MSAYKPKSRDGTVFKIKIKGRRPVTINMLEELAIDRHRLGQCLMEQPGKYAYFASLYEEVDAYLRKLEQKLTESALSYLKMRNARPTNALIESTFREDPQWIKYNILKGKLRVMKDALTQRATILSNQASLLKKERFFGS